MPKVEAHLRKFSLNPRKLLVRNDAKCVFFNVLVRVPMEGVPLHPSTKSSVLVQMEKRRSEVVPT